MRPQHTVPVVCLASLALASVSGAGAAPASCVPAAAQLLRSAGSARLYTEGGVLYGCLGARHTRLGHLRGSVPFPATRIALYTLSSAYAGIDTIRMGVDTFASSVALIDLRTGATRATAPGTTPERRPESFITVASMAVTATGALAWIGQRSAIGVPAPTFEVHALSAARNRLLASASDISPRSLTLRGRTLSWQAGGHTRTATL
jgi:hypothetical protein